MCSVRTGFRTALLSRADVQSLSVFWAVLLLWTSSGGQFFLLGDERLQLFQRRPVEHLQRRQKQFQN